MPPVIRYRNMIAQVLLVIVTLGFYAVYWFYVTANEMAAYLKREEPVFLWTILFFFPLISLYPSYKYGELYEKISPDMNRWVMTLLWFFFPPAVWLIVQPKMNRIALTALPPDSSLPQSS